MLCAGNQISVLCDLSFWHCIDRSIILLGKSMEQTEKSKLGILTNVKNMIDLLLETKAFHLKEMKRLFFCGITVVLIAYIDIKEGRGYYGSF